MRYALGAVLLLGCEALTPAPPAPVDSSLVIEVKRLGEDLKACMNRENDRLRAESAALQGQIDRALVELEELTRKNK